MITGGHCCVYISYQVLSTAHLSRYDAAHQRPCHHSRSSCRTAAAPPSQAALRCGVFGSSQLQLPARFLLPHHSTKDLKRASLSHIYVDVDTVTGRLNENLPKVRSKLVPQSQPKIKNRGRTIFLLSFFRLGCSRAPSARVIHHEGAPALTRGAAAVSVAAVV